MFDKKLVEKVCKGNALSLNLKTNHIKKAPSDFVVGVNKKGGGYARV